MKFFGFVSCVALLPAVLAQLPSCAVKCSEASLPVTSCSPTDVSCLCADAKFQAAAGACVTANCTVVETLQATNETYTACGIPIRSQSDKMIGVTASFGALAFIMVTLRLADRAISAQAQLGWDDLLIGLAGISSLFQNVPVIVAGRLGFGRDLWGIAPDNITNSFRWLYVTYFMYQVAEATCQLSICAFYLRIMTDKTSRIISWALIVVVTCFGLGNTFSMAFQCKPFAFFWDGWRGEMAGKCTVDVRLFGFIRGAIEICLDLVILILPLPMLSRLQMDMKKKLQIMSMFCVGFVITVVSCLRLWSLVAFDQTKNPTYDNTSGVYWCVTEANLFIIVACMPAMHALLVRVLPKYFSRFRNKGSYNSKGAYGSGIGKGGYFRHESEARQRSGSLPFGVITKSTDVNVAYTERSASDVELVESAKSSP